MERRKLFCLSFLGCFSRFSKQAQREHERRPKPTKEKKGAARAGGCGDRDGEGVGREVPDAGASAHRQGDGGPRSVGGGCGRRGGGGLRRIEKASRPCFLASFCLVTFFCACVSRPGRGGGKQEGMQSGRRFLFVSFLCDVSSPCLVRFESLGLCVVFWFCVVVCVFVCSAFLYFWFTLCVFGPPFSVLLRIASVLVSIFARVVVCRSYTRVRSLGSCGLYAVGQGGP